MTATEDRSRWIALIVLCVGMLMIVLDATVVNVALPSIQSDLGFSSSSLAWVVNAYLIAFGGLLLLAGRLGDLIGRRTVFLAGLAGFTAASALCGVAQSQEMLVAARFIQGIAGAMTSAVILGMIVTMFTQPRDQAKAIGVYGFVASSGGSVGLLAGGVLTQSINWHWIFFVNIPIGIATAVFALRLLPKDKGIGFGSGADVPGAALITAALMLLVYTIVVPAAEDGWGSGRTLGLGAGALALLAAFIVREATAANPLVPLRIFRSRNISGANIVQGLAVVGMFGMFFLGALYLQHVLGYDALQTGLAFLPATVVMAAWSLGYSEKLITRFGARTTLLPGLVLIGVALVAVRPGSGRRRLRRERPAGDGAARHRCRDRLPRADDAGHVRRDARRRRPRLRPGQHDRAGQRRDRPGRAGDAVGDAQRAPGRGRRRPGRGADRRVPPRVPDRRRADRRGAHRRADRAAPAAPRARARRRSPPTQRPSSARGVAETIRSASSGATPASTSVRTASVSTGPREGRCASEATTSARPLDASSIAQSRTRGPCRPISEEPLICSLAPAAVSSSILAGASSARASAPGGRSAVRTRAG